MKANEQLINALVRARNSKQPIALNEAIRLTPDNETAAYAVQKEVAQALDWFKDQTPKLWKLGGTPGQPSAAALPQSALQYHDTNKTLMLEREDECLFTGLELELAVKLNKTLYAGDNLDNAKAAIGEVYLALEVCDQRAQQWQSLPSLFKLADHQMNRSIILCGMPLSEWDEQLMNIAPFIQLGKEVINDNTLITHPQGHPLKMLPWLATLSEQLYQQPLQAGSIIATGAWAGIQTISESTPFKATLNNFPEIRVELTA